MKTDTKIPSFIPSGMLWCGYWFLSILLWEVLIELTVFEQLSGTLHYVAAFSLILASALALITTVLPRKIRFWGVLAITVVMVLLYGSQMVYNFVFGTLYSISQMGMGGNALAAFWKEVLYTMWENILWILALLIPVVPLTLIRIFGKNRVSRLGWISSLFMLAVSAGVYFVLMQSLVAGGTGYYSDYYYYTSDQVVTNQAASRFGLMTAFRLELLGSELDKAEETEPEQISTSAPEDSEPPESVSTEPAETEPTEPAVSYNVLEIDWDALRGLTEDKAILALNEYCSELTGTNKNEYTGMLRDYNLIVLCAESFSTAAIHPEVTPTLYRLANEGIIFNNFYNSYPNTTTDGEYSLCLGLFPDSSRTKASSSMYVSRNLYLPYALGNIFREELEVPGYGYHNYEGYYYGRDESHPNMGYSMKFMNDGMRFSYSWPSSDLEMMEQSVGDYISSDSQFHAYYMTFSGHYQYHVNTNYIARDNYKYVKHLDYSEGSKCYLACHVELDRALAYLMEKLEEAGVAEKTAIVIAGDHFPYGLSNYQYSELVGYTIDEFSKYKSSLIFWVGGLEENIVVDEYCCNVDILPTILNLWGFEYDSRILAGTDVFSDGEHVAVLSDKSFLTDKVWLNASNGKIKYLVEESELPEGYIDSMIRLVESKFTVSAQILRTGYYNFIYGKEPPEIDTKNW